MFFLVSKEMTLLKLHCARRRPRSMTRHIYCLKMCQLSLVSKALTLTLETKSLPSPPREGITGTNADYADAEVFTGSCTLLVAYGPGILPSGPPAALLLADERCSCMRIPGFFSTHVMGTRLRSLIALMCVAACKNHQKRKILQ